MISKKVQIVCFFVIIVILLSSCGSFPKIDQITEQLIGEKNSGQGVTPVPVEFNVEVREPISENETIVLSILDPITGLGVNPRFYEMKKNSPSLFQAQIQLPKTSTIYYKYLVQGNSQNAEVSSFGEPIDYRMYFNEDGGAVHDILAKWKGSQVPERYGQIRGTINDSVTGEPIPDIQINVSGIEAVTNGLGKFEINGLLSGENRITIRSIDGTYASYQQAALIEEGMATEANIALVKTELVKVTFSGKSLNHNFSMQSVRIIGDWGAAQSIDEASTTNLENANIGAFALTDQGNGEFSVTLLLPAGGTFQYKYTFGDGFWNAEKNSVGDFVVRHIIVPVNDSEFRDDIFGWSPDPEVQPVTLHVTVPPSTPSNEIITVQLNPYDWTSPLPMQRIGDGIWQIDLYQPLPVLTAIDFRFCRNYSCERGIEAMVSDGQTRTIDFASQNKYYENSVAEWMAYSGPPQIPEQTDVVSSKDSKFIMGLDLSENTNFSVDNSAVPNLRLPINLKQNTVIFPYTHSFRLDHPSMIRSLSSNLLGFNESISRGQNAKAAGINGMIMAKLVAADKVPDQWRTLEITPEFTDHLFAQYNNFLLSSAELAKRSESSGLIIDARVLWPLVPYFGEEENTDLLNRWQTLIGNVRGIYNGQIYFVVNYSNEGLFGMPAFAEQFDGFLIDWTAGLATEDGTTLEDMTLNAFYMMQNDIIPSVPTGKAILIGLNAPSTSGVIFGCSNNHPTNCMLADSPALEFGIDTEGQAMVYKAMLLAINQRDDIEGFFSRGFDGSVLTSDASSSIYGKEAFDLLLYWYPRWMGLSQ